MSDRTIVVTGATSGLGVWTARHLSAHTDRIALVWDPACAEAARGKSYESASMIRDDPEGRWAHSKV